MANEGIALSLTEPRLGWLAETGFVALLLLVFVGLTPFSPPPMVAAFGGVSESGAGDTLRQVGYVAVFAAILFAAFQRRGFAIVQCVPVMLALLLAWCLASALWADVPGIAFRRAGLAVVIVLSVMLSVDTVGSERSLMLWRTVLACVLVVNWLSIPLIANAVHPPGETDPALVGNWRGLYGHKNIAGSVSALTAILFLFAGLERRKWWDFAIAAAALGFLVMTRSKSSLGFLPVALIAGAVYWAAWRRSLDRAIVCAIALILFGIATTVIVIDSNVIARILEDPAEFTGRTAIWAAEIAYIADHPLLGAGFGTFADTGALSPLHNYVSGAWVENVSHGHNGYLQILVTIGGVGFVLAMLGLIASPLRRFWALAPHGTLKALLFALFVFLVLHNFMESDFLEGDGVTWVAFLLMIGLLRTSQREKALTARA